MSVKFCREKLDNERPNLPIEKPKVVKSCVPAGSLVKSKGSKILASKAVTKVNKVLVYFWFLLYYCINYIMIILIMEEYGFVFIWSYFKIT